MTLKMAVADCGRGGGKAVLAVPELPTGDTRRRLLLRYAELVTALGGTYRTAGDMNITPADLDIVAERCKWVYGTTERRRQHRTRHCTRCVCTEIRASIEHAFGSQGSLGPDGIWCQGVGSVGHDLARYLLDDGAHVLVADIAEDQAQRVAADTGAELVAAPDAIPTECDVLLAVRRRRNAQRRVDPAPSLSHRRRVGEQSAGRPERRRPPARKPESCTRPTT